MLAVISDGIYEYENGRGEPFGEARVQALIAANGRRGRARDARTVDGGHCAFAQGAPQEDDMTAVLVKRQSRALGTSQLSTATSTRWSR